MREIEFRGRRLDNEAWITGDLIRINGNTFIFPDPAPNGIDRYLVDTATVGQYTGLKDKTGRKIYEGDIMIIPETEFNAKIIGTVVYDEDSFVIKSRNSGSNWGLDWSLRKHDPAILGNIHDNPCLLK